MKKFLLGLLAIIFGFMAFSGFVMFGTSTGEPDPGIAQSGLAIGLIFTVLTLLYIRRLLKSRRSEASKDVFQPLPIHSVYTPKGYTEPAKEPSGPEISSFPNGTMTSQQVDAYYKRQRGREQWLDSYHLFEYCLGLDIEGFPKTFQTFQKHQAANSEKYREWMRQYEEKRNPAPPKIEDLISIRTERIDPDEGLETPAWAELSYLDAEALKFWNGKSTGFQIPAYYAGTAFGRNAGPALDRLLEGGYLRRGDIRKSIELKTIPDLKAVLSDKELKTSGKKGELVQRLLDNVPPEELEALFPEGVYEITEKGWTARAQYEIVFENQNYGLGFSDYRLIDAKGRRPGEEDAVILTRLLSEDIADCYRTGDRSRYQVLLPKGARFMEGRGEPLNALELSVLAYFVWTMEAKTLPLPGVEGQNYYLSRSVEEYGRRCGLTFDQLLEHFAVTVRENKPFALSSEANIRYALDMLKKGLSVNQ